MKKNYFIIGLVIFVFAVISFATNIIAPLESEIVRSYSLSGTLAGLLPFSFFIAYLISIPAAAVLDKWKAKRTMVAAFVFAGIGAGVFAVFPYYQIVVVSFFMIGCGMAALQVVINPLLRAATGEGQFAFYSVVAQVVFGLSAALAAPFSSWSGGVLEGLGWVSFEEGFQWVGNYWVIMVLVILVGLVLALIKIPVVKLSEDEKVEDKGVYKQLLSKRKTWAYFAAIFAYVGTEQGIGVKMKGFLLSEHGFTAAQGDNAIFWYWSLLTIGCLLGLVLVKLFDIKIVLRVFGLGAFALLALALYGGAQVSYYSFQWIGFCLSVMWSINFSLAMNSIRAHHGAFAGILCTGIIGGAVVPFLIGVALDLTGSLTMAVSLNFIPITYIISVSFWSRPYVTNERIKFKEFIGRRKPNMA